MARRSTKLPEGHVRMRIELTIEGEAEEATQKLIAVLKTLPLDAQGAALEQMKGRPEELKKGRA